MEISYKSRRLERVIVDFNYLTAAAVVATFVLLFGFRRPIVEPWILHSVQFVLFATFVLEKVIRYFNATQKIEYWRANWFEVPLLAGLAVAVLGAGRLFGKEHPLAIQHTAVGIYLVAQVVIKVCRTVVRFAATGRSPARVLIASFLVLILIGAGLLTLPRSSPGQRAGFVDALFSATSAVCVTGLVVRDTGKDYSLMGQLVILSLIQLGGLGIVMFGGIFAVLLGQALSVRESAAMQDLLSERTLGRINKVIAFVFVGTIVIEAVGAACMYGMWQGISAGISSAEKRWYYSVFHSISAFCNAGFGLFTDNLVSYSRSWGTYLVVCPLIVLGGLGFGVLYNLSEVFMDRAGRLISVVTGRYPVTGGRLPRRMHLQTKIVLLVTAILIISGTGGIMFFEHVTGEADGPAGTGTKCGILDGLFQSVTARTAGFNTVDIGALSASSQFLLILLMFIGGSPGGTAGGIKTVTLAVVIMAVFATMKKRDEVEIFKRSVRLLIVRRAITITFLFTLVLFAASLGLAVTERHNGFTMMQMMFETGSALGTVGLSTGITPCLTAAGKLIIILVMLVGRLGPLTLLASVTFNLRAARYSYPEEAVMVG